MQNNMDFTGKYTGFAKVRVVAINPDKEWLEENTGEILEEEPDYCFTTKDRNKGVKIDIWMENVEGQLFKYEIYLEDKEVTSKTGAYKYINCLGAVQWANEDTQLWTSFLHFEEIHSWNNKGVISKKWSAGAVPEEKEIVGNKQYHVSRVGEEQLLHFIKMLEQPNLYSIDTNLFLDLDKLFDGDFKTLHRMVRNGKDFHFTAFMYLDNSLNQKVWKEFMKVDFMRDVMNNMKVSSYNSKAYKDWLKNFEGDFGCDGHYEIGKLQLFKEEFLKNAKELTNDGSDY